MRRPLTFPATVLAMLMAFVAPLDAAPPKDKPDPDRRLLEVKKDGEKIGELSYKWVRTTTGNEFASSKVELKTGGSSYVIRTHLKRNSDGVVDKYKKWIGLEGAKPDVIVFWKDKSIRTVSKVPDRTFTRTFKPPASFSILDEMGFHLYRDFVRSWRRDGDGAQPILCIRDGRFGEATVSHAGTAQVTRKDKARTVDVVAVEFDNQRTLIYADEEDELWGIMAPGLTLTRSGWSLGDVQAPVAAPVDSFGTASGPETPPTGGEEGAASGPAPEGDKSPTSGASSAQVDCKTPPTEEKTPIKPKPLPLD